MTADMGNGDPPRFAVDRDTRPCDERGVEPIEPPPPLKLLGEPLGLLELPRLLLRFPRLAKAPRGDGSPVLVLPGYGAGDASTAVLQAYLRFLGYRPLGWGLGRNGGNVPELLPRVLEKLKQVAGRARRPVALIGWSLGGYLAREAARDLPELARKVVTLGSPVVGGPKYTTVANRYRAQGIDLDEIEAHVAAREVVPLRTSVTAIYSRSDGVVAWRACIDRHNACVEHVEVDCTHVGLGFSADVYEIVARSLVAVPERIG